MITGARLVDGAREMTLTPRDGVFVQGIEVSSPEVRAVAESRSDDDGERDTTELFGARAVTVDLLVVENPSAVQDELTSYLHPRSRPYLYVADDEWTAERRIKLRSEQWAAPLSAALPPSVRELQANWRAPDGVWEDADLTSVTVNADVPTTVGMSFPHVFPFAFTATAATGSRLIDNPGTTDVHIVARLYGPCTAPVLTNETTGQALDFSGLSGGGQLSIPAGDYLEVNTQDRTALYLSNAGASRLTYLDFLTSSWWRLQPGTNQVRYHPVSASAGAVAVVEYRSSWL